MSSKGYGAVREYRDDPALAYSDNPAPRRGAGFESGSSFSTMTDELSSHVFQINSNASVLERQLNEVGTPRDNAALRQKIHDTEQKTNKLIATSTQLFKQLARQRAPNRQAAVQIERLRSDFEETIQRYNRLQKLVASRVKSAPLLSSQSKTGVLVDFHSEAEAGQARQAEDQRQAQLQAQSDVIEADVQLIEEREEQVRQLESDIININEIFRDLAALVYEQGDLVDSIEANVEKGYDNVESGNKQLQAASKYAVKYRKKLCCFAVVIAVIAAIITIILVVELRKK